VHYRQGSYEELLEFYLKGELKGALDLFKKQSKGNPFKRAEELLLQGENNLEKAQSLWGKNPKTKNEAETELSNEVRRWLAATYYRIGELKWLQEKFDKEDKEEGALAYLKKAIYLCDETGYLYRGLSAKESYVTACYFHKEYNDDFDDDCKKYIQTIEEFSKEYPLVLAKLRITQGDEIFSRIFKIEIGPARHGYRDAHGILRAEVDRDGNLPKTVEMQLRTMVSYYIEACSLMQETKAPRNFVIAVRVLTRRFRVINDALAQECVHGIFQDTWNEYENLQNSQNEMKNILEFSRILNGLARKKC
jgi:hypothetical protein